MDYISGKFIYFHLNSASISSNFFLSIPYSSQSLSIPPIFLFYLSRVLFVITEVEEEEGSSFTEGRKKERGKKKIPPKLLTLLSTKKKISSLLFSLLFLFPFLCFSFFFVFDIHDWLYILPFLFFLIGLRQNGYTENSRYVIYTSSIRFSVQSSPVQSKLEMGGG